MNVVRPMPTPANTTNDPSIRVINIDGKIKK